MPVKEKECMKLQRGIAIGLSVMLASGTALAQPPRTSPQAARVPVPPTSAFAQAPRTLEQALAITYSTNPTLLAERAKLRATDESVPQALAGWRPTVVLSGSAGYINGTATQFANGNGISTSASRDIATMQATVTQPLYRGGKTRAATHQAENSVLAERSRLISTEQQVFSQTVNAYVSVIAQQQVVALNQSNVQVLTQQLRATNDRYRVGEITRTDVAQAEAALAGAQATLQTSIGNLQAARATFRQVVGVEPGDLVPPQPLALPVRSQQDATRIAAANNPDVVAAMFDNSASKDAVDVAFSSLMPQLSLQASTFRDDNSQVPHTRSVGQEIVANLSIPIYQGGSEYATVRQARQQEQQTRKVVDQQRRSAVQQAAQAWETLVAARATITSTREQIRANQIALEGVEREALLGSRTTLDVLNAQQTLLNSQVTLVQNLANLVLDSYSLAAALGRLTAHDLNLPVNYYDETAYYRAVRNKLWGTGDEATNQPGR
jgi:outer membrane protein